MSIKLKILEQADKEDYIQFLETHFTESISAADIRNSASKEIDCMFSDYFRKPVFYGFYSGGELIGTSGIIREWICPDTWSIFWVCVHKDHRGKGYGRQIMEDTVKDFADVRLNGRPGTMLLGAMEHNCAFYESLGYERGPKGHNWYTLSKAINV